eukprot:TRINITY_DN105892_c0_g1_i1.p1 TRINITY_DN105892_c0_g1~~TRINITY_DN105892_c0_g1_i1.p1  ORF type:complete len:1662 (-),score=474.65 TRINITY_DN105892_c0_g1_i1:61-4488(-)
MNALADDCLAESQSATQRVLDDLEANIVACNRILEPLEPPPLPLKSEGDATDHNDMMLEDLPEVPLDGTIDPVQAKAMAAERVAQMALRALGERTEDEVRAVMSELEAAIVARRRRVVEFAGEDGELARIDEARKQRTEELLQMLVEALMKGIKDSNGDQVALAAAHVQHGEVERLVEDRAHDLNAVLLENRKATRQLEAKLAVQTLELSKENKTRWHKGLLLWKQQRHRHSIAVVMRRIRSNEFKQPDVLVEAMERVRDQQLHVFQQRKHAINDLFAIPQRKLMVAAVRSIEEHNTQLNDRAQEVFDALLVELKEIREALEVSAEQMLGELGLELELHDARQEWKGHESVANLIDADVRPPLQACLDQVAELLVRVSDKLSKQEEALHLVVTRTLSFFLGLAKKQEQLKKRVDEFEVQYNGDLEDCEKDFEELCEQNENRMVELHSMIDDAAHHEDLDELKQTTFDHLDSMALGYRGHADDLLGIHNAYPGDALALIRRETRGYCQDLGLALEPTEEAEAWAAERKKLLEEQEREAVEKVQAAHAPVPDEDAAAAAAREEAMAAAVEAAKAEVQQAAEEREANALEQEAANAEALAEKPAWPQGSSTGCSVLERMPLSDLHKEVVIPAETPVEGAEAEGEGDAAEGEDGADVAPADVEPVFADGTAATETLDYDEQWFQDHLSQCRAEVFENITSLKQYLDRVDIPAACEDVRRELDQRLRRHTNRKGEVQVEWYVPRYGTVAKHKDKFERHLVDIARKCQEQDDSVDNIFKEVDEAEEHFKQRLLDLKERLGEAETMPVLTSFERQASDASVTFKDFCKAAHRRLLDLSSKAPQALQKENNAFLKMCEKGDEQYSKSELKFYGGEVEELNTALDDRKEQRGKKACEMESQIEERCKAPMAEFAEFYATAVETLCASKGYGRKYGAPRRKAQERVRTLISRAATVKQNIQQLLDQVVQLMQLPAQEGGIEITSVPPNDFVSLKTFFRRGGDSWNFTGEVLGTLYVTVCTMAVLGSHLGAFKESKAPKYLLSAVPSLRILREDASVMPAKEKREEVLRLAQEAKGSNLAEMDGEARLAAEVALRDAQSLEAETALREDFLLRVLGPLLKSENFNVEIESIVKASHEAYAGQAGGTPDFMQTFLSEMQASSEHSRQESCRKLRVWGDELRETTLLTLGDSLFEELTMRSLAEMQRATREAHEKTVQRWSECDKLRTSHEQKLNPRLADANKEAELLALVEAEAQRYESALGTCRDDREAMATALRGAAESYVCRLTSVAEQAMLLVDLLPLHSHFGALPGDEKVEPPRMSIKRRLRRLNASAEAPASPTEKVDPKAKGKAAAAPPPDPTPEEPGLPERQWLGLPKYELRAKLYGNGWPEDPDLAPPEGDPTVTEDMAGKPDPQKLQELTSSLNSFRSPVHRSIIDGRLHHYEKYKAQFQAEVERRFSELTARETKEEAGERNWQSMVQQLRGEAEH